MSDRSATSGWYASCDELRLRPGVSLGLGHGGAHYLLAGRAGSPVGRLTAGQRRLLERLAGQPVSLAALLKSAGDCAEPADSAARLVARLGAGGWLTVTVRAGDRPGYTVLPFRRPPRPAAGTPPRELVLSRFAVVRRTGDEFTVEAPHAWCAILLHEPALLAVLGDLTAGREPGGAAARLVGQLWHAGMAVPPGAEEQELRWRQWYPHELWFHHHSRASHRHQLTDGNFGGTSWAQHQFDPLPPRPDPYPGPAVDLPEPDPVALRTNDPPLAAVVANRRSSRTFDDRHPLTLAQISELLHRCGRTTTVDTPSGEESQSRPYPSGGGGYELELYLVVRLASGLAAGMYHYDSHQHRLVPVTGPGQPARWLLDSARDAAGLPQPPQLLLIAAARFGRVMWKYEQISYALVLKHAGVLYQSVYLAATAMRIGVCGLGVGDVAAFAEATGRDPLVESSVGELVLGSLPTTEGEQP